MIELYFAISSKKTGEEVLRDHGNFDNLESFYNYILFKYGYTSRDYSFILSGRERR